MSIELVTLLLFSSMIIFLALGVPIAYALGAVGAIFTIFLWGPQGLYTVPLKAIYLTRTIILTAIPLFIFMGNILEVSGIADDLYEMIHRWIGQIRGGLAIGTVIICTIFAAMTGISGAATVTMGIIALPAMLKRRYDKSIAIGCIMGGGALGVLIPPSTLMIIYGWLTGESVGRLFAGGVFPGLLLSTLFIIYIAIRCAFQPDIGPVVPVEERANWKMKITSLKAVVLPMLIILGVLGSIFSGAATPTEAAAVGVLGAFISALVYRRLTWQNFKTAILRTFRVNGFLLWIVLGASYFVTVYIALGAPDLIVNLVSAMPINPWFIIIGMQVILIILGMFMETTGIAMITLPVFVPLITSLGFDSVWFGILFVINAEMGFLTPPFGVNLFYMRGVVPEGITIADIYRSVIPFVLLQLIGLVIVMLFPQIALWLPNLIFGVSL